MNKHLTQATQYTNINTCLIKTDNIKNKKKQYKLHNVPKISELLTAINIMTLTNYK